MLTLDRLALHDFGPYRGLQEMTFLRENGVYIIYGPNGRGKTTLQNAIRYVLYGEILGRRGAERPSELANTVSKKENGYGFFEISLDFHHSGIPYRLMRRYDERSKPEELTLLERDRVPLSPDEADRALQNIAPMAVRQFFLFDAEDLRRYENLLDDASEDGVDLAKSIERVLGLPVVENALTDVLAVQRAASKQLIAIYANNTETQRLGIAMRDAESVRDGYQDSHDQITAGVAAAEKRFQEIGAQIRDEGKGQRLVGKIDSLKLKRGDLTVQMDKAAEALRQTAGDLWKAVLSHSAAKRLTVVDKEVAESELSLREAIAAARDLAHLQNHEDCPVCRREVPADLRSKITQALGHTVDSSMHQPAETLLAEARSRRQTLLALTAANATLIAERDARSRELRLDLQECNDDIAEHEQELRELGKDNLRQLLEQHAALHTKIEKDKERLSAASKQISDQDRMIEDIKRKVRRMDVRPDPALAFKDEVSQQLIKLFSESIEAYREKLRRRVESRASEIFSGLTSEPDYKSLRLAGQYGLEIIDSEGETVRRSAGYEHLVALSLIAALQDSAAVRGPVIMDYPFGRLDSDNTARAIASLPRMARQVILLAFDGEFDRTAAIRALGTSLVAEFELEKVAPKHVSIQRRSMI